MNDGRRVSGVVIACLGVDVRPPALLPAAHRHAVHDCSAAQLPRAAWSVAVNISTLGMQMGARLRCLGLGARGPGGAPGAMPAAWMFIRWLRMPS